MKIIPGALGFVGGIYDSLVNCISLWTRLDCMTDLSGWGLRLMGPSQVGDILAVQCQCHGVLAHTREYY